MGGEPDGSPGIIQGVRHKQYTMEGVQFHPEFTSTPRDGHPLFSGYVNAAREFNTSSNKQKAFAQ